MKESTRRLLDEFKEYHLNLKECMEDITESIRLLKSCYENDGKVLTCGNGGSAADSEHIVGELMKGFCKRRELKGDEKYCFQEFCETKEAEYLKSNLQGALPAISLVSHSSLITAFMNDVKPDMIFAQQVLGYGRKNDILIGLSTSGNSCNVVNAARVAKSLQMKVISFTGENPSKLSEISDVTLQVPEHETYKVQEEHIKIYHLICQAIENEFFEE